jgi:hypothetical protein
VQDLLAPVPRQPRPLHGVRLLEDPMSEQDWKSRERSLTASERETVVLMDDESDMAIVTTWQRRIITKLEKNPAAEKLWDQRLGTSRGAQFRLPANLISFRSKTRKGGPGNAESLRKAREAA